jgi:glycosyltransferase involved in cell wall biosynthesis
MAIPATDMISEDTPAIRGRNRFDESLMEDADKKFAPEVIAVIPAYNEEVAIGSVVLGALQYSDHVIVVDDGSRDKTAKLAELAGAQVIRMNRNGGKAKALLTGLKIAERRGCRVAVTLDGDGQHRPEDISIVAMPVLNGDADLVIGSRYIGKQRDIPRYRKFGQKVINRLSNVGAKADVTDSQSGLRALSKLALRNLNFSSDGYNVESDMIAHFVDKGLTIREVPIDVKYDVPNGHKKGAVSMGMGLLGNVVSVIGYKRPLLMFGAPGVVLLMAGLVLGILTAVANIFISSFLMQALIAVGMVTVGAFLCVSALTLNSLTLLMKSKL